MAITGDPEEMRRSFFKLVTGRATGYFCISALTRDVTKRMTEYFFNLPTEFEGMLEKIEELAHEEVDLYFCPHTFNTQERLKKYVEYTPSVWADLDECRPEEVEPQPSVSWQTSPGRFQALWLLDGVVDPHQAEHISKRIAYAYADRGCDKSGWDISQLLRIPGTKNYKYIDTDSGPVDVFLLGMQPMMYRADEFAHEDVEISIATTLPFPKSLPNKTGRELIDGKLGRVTKTTLELFENVPTKDWSGSLWQLMMQCFEAGMEKEEVLVVARDAACNKYARDGRSDEYVWNDVCRALDAHNEQLNRLTIIKKAPDDLLTPEEYERVADVRTFVEDYIDWASSLGDAATQYHQGGAFIILSSLLAGSVHLPTSFGKIIPNLWFMILADTTLTRKSTAMDIATDLLVEVESDAVMATDGSIEGLMQGLSTRPGRPSMFLRDEFSGLLEQITKKDYYAGMAEVLTKLYDGKLQKRMLRKEIIEVRDPVLIVFAGGIRNRVQQLLKFDHISSGFIPRFLFLTAESDASRVQPLGPPTDLDMSGRTELIEAMVDMKNHYAVEDLYELPTGVKIPKRRVTDAYLTPEAWKRYNQFEKGMLEAGLKTERPELMTPLFDRLAKSTLKAAILLAATRQREQDVRIDIDDILLAMRYAMGWRDYAIDVINGVGKTATENQIDTIYNGIVRTPGISRGVLMRNYHLTAREADAIFETLDQRGLINKSKVGKGMVYHAA